MIGIVIGNDVCCLVVDFKLVFNEANNVMPELEANKMMEMQDEADDVSLGLTGRLS
jgi:hypothetical protein